MDQGANEYGGLGQQRLSSRCWGEGRRGSRLEMRGWDEREKSRLALENDASGARDSGGRFGRSIAEVARGQLMRTSPCPWKVQTFVRTMMMTMAMAMAMIRMRDLATLALNRNYARRIRAATHRRRVERCMRISSVKPRKLQNVSRQREEDQHWQ